MRSIFNWVCSVATLSVLGLIHSPAAYAVPSFASQTGAACSQCHTVAFGPALTPFGQQFKLNGYSWGDSAAVPLAAMVIGSVTVTDKSQPGGAAPHFGDNGNAAVDQTSLFYAGKLADNAGAFVQATYDGVARRGSWDNLDVRYARKVSNWDTSVVWGLSLNNSPTVQDLWNSTPAWSFPYAGSALAPAPSAAPILEGALAQQVLGLTGYTMIADHLYLEGGAYKTLPRGVLRSLGALGRSDSLSSINAPAPYWRAVLQNNFGSHYVSAGIFGINAKLNPGSNSQRDRYTDIGYDATWQYTSGKSYDLNANVTYLHERQDLQASASAGDVANARNHLSTLRANAGIVLDKTYSLSAGAFDIRGGSDATLYSPSSIGGSANGSPNSRGYMGQLEFVPFGKSDSWMKPFANVRLGLQYTWYSEFNGSKTNYDGAGRNAKDNNTLFAFLWFAI